MKQHITHEQLGKLSEKSYNHLYDIYNNNNGSEVPILSIGQMIEFLDEERKIFDFSVGSGISDDTELCDTLWEAVKECL